MMVLCEIYKMLHKSNKNGWLLFESLSHMKSPLFNQHACDIRIVMLRMASCALYFDHFP